MRDPVVSRPSSRSGLRGLAVAAATVLLSAALVLGLAPGCVYHTSCWEEWQRVYACQAAFATAAVSAARIEAEASANNPDAVASSNAVALGLLSFFFCQEILPERCRP